MTEMSVSARSPPPAAAPRSDRPVSVASPVPTMVMGMSRPVQPRVGMIPASVGVTRTVGL